MKYESGRSLVELIGVLAIGAVMTAAGIATYNTIRNRQARTIAVSSIEQIAKNTRLLFGGRGDYSGVSVEYLIKAGALKNGKQPIGAPDWSVSSSATGREFSINLNGLSSSDCSYFTTVRMDFVSKIRVNGYDFEPGVYCLGTGGNQVSFIVE